jgi:hypothetical protein
MNRRHFDHATLAGINEIAVPDVQGLAARLAAPSALDYALN